MIKSNCVTQAIYDEQQLNRSAESDQISIVIGILISLLSQDNEDDGSDNEKCEEAKRRELRIIVIVKLVHILTIGRCGNTRVRTIVNRVQVRTLIQATPLKDNIRENTTETDIVIIRSCLAGLAVRHTCTVGAVIVNGYRQNGSAAV